MKSIERSFLVSEYVEKRRTSPDIANELGVDPVTVRNRLKLFGISRRTSGELKRIDLTGKKFGILTVVRLFGSTQRGKLLWEAKCECGNIRHFQPDNLISGHSKSCGCILRKIGHEHFNWCGHGEIGLFWWNSVVRRAADSNKKFDLDIKYGWDLFLFQNRKCKLSGSPIHFASSIKAYNRGETTASLDRIDSSIGYEEGNVQWVHKSINKMKSDLPQDVFIDMCIRVASFQKGRQE